MKTDHELAQKIVDEALMCGADEAEVYTVSGKNLTIEVKKGEIDSLEKSVSAGYSVRIIKDRRQGFSYSTNPGDYKKCIEDAIETSRWTEEDPYVGLPGKGSYEEVKIFDPAVESLGEESLKDMVLSVEAAAFETDRRITKTRKTTASVSSAEITIINSKDVSLATRSTSVSSHIMVIAEDGGDSQTGWEYQGSRYLKNIDFQAIGRAASVRALQLLGAEKSTPAKTQIILENAVACEFLSIFASALSSESIQKGKSLLAGKVGERVASNGINIVDHALVDELSGSRPFDAEGVATTNKTLIDAGILRGYLYNTYTAKKDNTLSTGNAVRGGFSSVPAVGITNLFVKPAQDFDSRPFDALVASVGNGLLVKEAMGVHTANPISGDFSVGVTGLLIKDGSFLCPVKEAVISGNILDLFQNIIACGDDLRFFGKIGSPSLLIREMDISA